MDDSDLPEMAAHATVKTAQCKFRGSSEARVSDPRKSNRVMSRIIPPFLVGIAIFSTYVWFDMCIQWHLRNGRTTTGICLLLFEIVLLILLAGSFFRITFTHAGYLPNRADRNRVTQVDAGESGIISASAADSLHSGTSDYHRTYDRKPTSKEVRDFLSSPSVTEASIYIARADPSDGARYCSICDVEKNDRAHHCSEVNRCIKKFDHYCPWVGGPIGFTRYKFFFQFITYAAIYCVYITVTLGIAVSQRKRAAARVDNVQHIPANPGLWYACIALGGLFGSLMIPFSCFHGHQIAINKSTLEYLDIRGTPVIVRVTKRDEFGNLLSFRQRINLAPDTHPFNIGLWHNWQQVLGIVVWDKWVVFRLLNWILPIHGSYSPGNGLTFPYDEALIRKVQAEAEKHSYNNSY
ncbi:Palmitoyltransferase PFA5 [Taphrina deformans PYCC 5710]|uniref:Palmitoyltransferase n=1 Tax=Taphrina deformans (strain PYCC 5710 / ATCC 11124 / CBS 356.35 / IMI 108563 / JCM 9778 / NBRC 8474) TaxID=1097556 RepID=R4XCS6_TAPDE|nr:Palmitoyltransferase PFA5 [Taphrina deformans PYCC 5710]|eukprot:CCG83660.1 Palmitoyltransferase PFA5 [Taphrina deformans PYCC 5710]